MASTLSQVGAVIGSSSVVLGGLVLSGAEVPDRLEIGGRQMMVVHRLPGGGRVVDILGNDPGRLELRGRFLGPDALSRARMLERLRLSGEAVSFSAAGLVTAVWIAGFAYAVESGGAVIPYELTLERPAEVVSGGVSGVSLAEAVADDLGGALSGLSAVTSAFSGMSGTVAGQVTSLSVLLNGPVASATSALASANGTAEGSSDLAASSGDLQGVSTDLASAGSDLTSVVSVTGENLEGIDVSSADALNAAAGNAALSSAAADAGGLVNRSAAQVAEAQGDDAASPLVHS